MYFLLIRIKTFKLEKWKIMRFVWKIITFDCSFSVNYLNFCSVVKKKYVSRYHRQLAYPYPPRSFAHVFMVWGSSSRKEILYGVGRATDSIMGVCQYPGRCYHSEACMAGVGNDVTHLGTAPHWKHDLIAEPTCIEKIFTVYRRTSCSFSLLLYG